jgi:hypothetical protein
MADSSEGFLGWLGSVLGERASGRMLVDSIDDGHGFLGIHLR